jgi:hypothetical protein
MSADIEFTYDAYRAFLDEFKDRGYSFRGFGDPATDDTIILRHDVDWSPERALRMARIEAERGVQSTYFFLVTSPFYNVLHEDTRDILRTIQGLRHDVGVHFSTHEYWRDDPGNAAVSARVREEQRILDTVVEDPTDAVSFHIPPDWVIGTDYDGFTNAYAPAYIEEMAYAADSNQRWREDPPFDGGLPERVQVLVHPGVWAESDERFAQRLDSARSRRFDAVRAYLDEQYGSVVQ